MKTKPLTFSVIGPVARDGYYDGKVALSAAQTLAVNLEEPGKLTIVCSDGTEYGRVERDADGIVWVHRYGS